MWVSEREKKKKSKSNIASYQHDQISRKKINTFQRVDRISRSCLKNKFICPSRPPIKSQLVELDFTFLMIQQE